MNSLLHTLVDNDLNVMLNIGSRVLSSIGSWTSVMWYIGPCSPSTPPAVPWWPIAGESWYMLRTCWCSASGNTETTMVSDVGTGWCFLHGIPSTMSNGDQSFQQWLFSTTLLNVYIFGRTDMALSISIMFTQQDDQVYFTKLADVWLLPDQTAIRGSQQTWSSCSTHMASQKSFTCWSRVETLKATLSGCLWCEEKPYHTTWVFDDIMDLE